MDGVISGPLGWLLLIQYWSAKPHGGEVACLEGMVAEIKAWWEGGVKKSEWGPLLRIS